MGNQENPQTLRLKKHLISGVKPKFSVFPPPALTEAASSRPGQHVSAHRRGDRRIEPSPQPARPEAASAWQT